jgi:DNA-binding PadR family transcriptional regulator
MVALAAGDLHGYAIMQAVERSSEGDVRMGPATLYGTLKKLVDLQLAQEVDGTASASDDGRRRYYRLTGLGSAVCLAETDRLAELVRRARASLRPRTA